MKRLILMALCSLAITTSGFAREENNLDNLCKLMMKISIQPDNTITINMSVLSDERNSVETVLQDLSQLEDTIKNLRPDLSVQEEKDIVTSLVLDLAIKYKNNYLSFIYENRHDLHNGLTAEAARLIIDIVQNEHIHEMFLLLNEKQQAIFKTLPQSMQYALRPH